MSNELQLSNARFPYGGGAAIEPWAQGGAGGGALVAPQPPLQKIHRLLRGRYLLAVLLAFVGAAAGGVAGYMSQKPGYKSMGTLEINPLVPDIDSVEKIMLMYTQHMQSQVARLQGVRLIEMALKDPNWKKATADLPDGPMSAAAFKENLKVEYVKGTSLITVTFQHPKPAAAQAGVQAVLTAYKERFAKDQRGHTSDFMKHHEKAAADLKAQIANWRHDIEEVAGEYTDDLAVVLTNQYNTVNQIDRLCKDAERALNEAVALKNQGYNWTAEEVAEFSPQMHTLLAIRDKTQTDIATLQRTQGNNGPTMVQLQNQFAVANQNIDNYLKTWKEKYVGIQQMADGTRKPLPSNLDTMRENVRQLQKMYDTEAAKAKDLAQRKRRIEDLRTQIANAEIPMREAQRRAEEGRFRLSMIDEPDVLSYGDPADVGMDSRMKFGLLGCVAGGGLPIALLLLVGLLDHRYRYSDEATGPEMTGITLLGILPNLPDRLSDPEQAAIAAHCVHQIRTMLQINGGFGAEDRRVFAVTSAAPGDGKTSLTLALGLSYAACGTRTLLIDCDLIGAGLSTRMNVNEPEGVLEAVASRQLLPYVRTTDIADVAILPVGMQSGHHASTLSPQALRRLIDEAKQHFDTVLIDTGPILGSIEASLVCAAADSVVLTVSRRQLRPLVERSLSHLTAIGARLAGIVFNRAESNDFERSISGVSLRSAAAANGGATGTGRGVVRSNDAVGPVARAVSAHVKDANN